MIKQVNPKGNQHWIFIGRTDDETEAPILWPPDAKSWLTGKDDAGKDWGQEEKGTIEDEMAGWHHWLEGHESEWTPGVGDGQGGLTCCVHGVAKSRTQLSDWSDLIWLLIRPYFSLLQGDANLWGKRWLTLWWRTFILKEGVGYHDHMQIFREKRKQWLWQLHALHSEAALPGEFDKSSVVIFHTKLFGIFVN